MTMAKNMHFKTTARINPGYAVCLFLVLAIVVVYGQVGNHEFISLDDYEYITENRHIADGLTPEGIGWAFTSFYAANWHPLTWLSHMLDIELYGMNPGAHHLTNLLFHIVNSLLVFYVFFRMTGQNWPSGLAAALFALHPLHVESVVWISERKDVLSTFFMMLTLLCYVRYTERTDVPRYLMVVVLYMLGLMAKPMLVTLPFVLLLLDYWPLKRVQFGDMPGICDRREQHRTIACLIREKLPFIVLSGAASVVTLFAQQSKGALYTFPIAVRIGNALLSYMNYIGKMIWPLGLTAFYPHSRAATPFWEAAACSAFLMGISIGVLYFAKRYPFAAVGWFWFMITLVPVIGLVQVGSQAMADRYTYIPLIGLFIILSWGWSCFLERLSRLRPAVWGVTCCVMVSLMALSWLQVGYWRTNKRFFEHMLAVNPNNHMAHNGVGRVLAAQGKYDVALKHFSEALGILPKYVDARINLADALVALGKVDEAVDHYVIALKINPKDPRAHNNMGIARADQGKYDEAIRHFTEALRLNPLDLKLRGNLGIALFRKGKIKEAIACFENMPEADPDILKNSQYYKKPMHIR